jgi:hypothetical protein
MTPLRSTASVASVNIKNGGNGINEKETDPDGVGVFCGDRY